MNVGKMWKTPEKCGKHVGMWKTCGKHVGNSFVCANVQNCRQLYKRESIFFFLFFVRGYVYECVLVGGVRM